MNTFIHRILKSSTASSITCSRDIAHRGAVANLLDEIQNAKLIYFGEFHSETRIISFQTELVKEWAKRLGSSSCTGAVKPRLHLIMEHFSVDMQDLLNKYQCLGVDEPGPTVSDNQEAFEQLVDSYKAIGTEGHDLVPYSNLLQFCRETTTKLYSDDDDRCCEVLLHGGFIPRNHAARLNKECPDEAAKRLFFDEMSNERGYLPKKGDAMYNALFETSSDSALRGPKEHKMLIESLMTGTDLYSPVDASNGAVDEGDECVDEEKPFDRLYQAQLLKDHAMGYKVANTMLDQPCSDRFIIIAGFGHLKHYLGVPDCVNQYLRQAAMLGSDEKQRAKAMDLLMNISRLPTLSKSRNMDGKGSVLIGCQMMYEAYLEDHYPPLVAEISKAAELDEDADTDEIKQRVIKQLYLHKPATLDEYILKSDEVRGPLLNYDQGMGGFEQPCADYMFIYDEDDEHVITKTDLLEASSYPYHNESTNGDAKKETLEAYQQVGETAGLKGNAKRARAIMSILGYTEDDLCFLGDGDTYNFQGVANPHLVAKIQSGESVIDIGSGLGIDSFLAMRDCNAGQKEANHKSFVVGVDLAPSEVQHASKRAAARGYGVERLRFIQGDVENLQAVLLKHDIPPQNNFDVCISNGAFCLAPDKKKAFQNGGRCAISTTTIVSGHLDPSFEWPVCMRMFASLESLQPMLAEIGFKNVKIIDAESPMEGMELPEDDADDNAGDSKRFKIHGKYVDQFAFLEKMDMDELCKVVTVYGEKP